MLVLPPHYAQLAAALGLNTQHLLPTDPVSTRTDFERLIELNRAQAVAAAAAASSIKCEMDVVPMEDQLKSEIITSSSSSSTVKELEGLDEQNQNNQNILNQPPPPQHLHAAAAAAAAVAAAFHDDNGQPQPGCDDNMWRPW